MGASVSLRRRVQWMDTDAAGIWHHSTLIRWAEEAEAEMHRELGIIDQTFGVTPRVKLEFEFLAPVRFDDEVQVILSVGRLGESSIEYLVDVDKDGQPIATGSMIAVLIDGETGESRPWPDELRGPLSGS